ncbi:hypothetical protein BJF78_02950 [Pseudonocardia sp. CNS-139]|nr:hypothetical protein BJF78_02950 [Pseudonocardia sp. CNS-139]
MPITEVVPGPPTLVVGHGRDQAGDRALAVAIDLAHRLGARLHVVHVADARDYPVDPDAADWEEQGRRTLAKDRRHVERILAATGLTWTYEARRGEPATELTRAADEHDALMLVVGTRGEGLRAAVSRMVEPSVSHGVIRREHRPVLVVPGP